MDEDQEDGGVKKEMTCPRCQGLVVLDWLDHEQTQHCLLCGWIGYPPIPAIPERTRCFYCKDSPALGLVSCLVCTEKMKQYRAAHPKKKRYIGAQLPNVMEVKQP